MSVILSGGRICFEKEKYMGLFDKKYCDVCGEKIGMLGNRKLEDGNLCKDCASKLSPFFSDRKHSTVDEIKQQLAYREANKQQVHSFSPTASFGDNTKVHVDQNMGAFIVTSRTNWREENPDVIPLSSVTNCNLEVKENKTEIYREVERDGRTMRESFSPPKYEYHYDFKIIITVRHDYFDEISFDLCGYSDRPTSVTDARYQRLQQVAMQIENALLPGRNAGMGMNMGMGGMNMGMNGMNNMGMNGMNMGMAGMGMNGMNQMGMNQGMNNMGMQGNMGMNQMGMNGMNQMGMNQGMNNMGMNGMNQMGMNQGMNNMGMNQMNGMGMQNGMNNMGMNQGMNNMGMQGNMGMNQGMGAPMGQNPAAGPWMCACGTSNTGAFCEGCGNPRP